MILDCILQCDEAINCKNSIEIAGEERSKCYTCRFSPDNEGKGQVNWKPIDGKSKHPILVKEKSDREYKKRTEAIAKRQARSKIKMSISRQAVKAEQDSEANIIKSTKNSGRSNRDSDHVVAGGIISLDTKLQTTKTNPEIDLAQLEKAIADGKRGGSLTGGLLIRNKHGVGIVCIKEEDFGKYILSRLI